MPKKTVAMVGFSPSSRSEAPYDNPDIQIWTLNKAHMQDWMKRFDVIFQLHTVEYLEKCIGLSDGDRKHWDWLKEKHDYPIYMQEKFKQFPSSMKYPLEQMKKQYGDFFTGTPAYMMALAIHQGFERIELYGFDMASNTEYEKQRDSMEYFIGMAEGMGIEVYIPEDSPLLKGRLYALEGSEIGLRQLMEFRVRSLETQLKVKRAKYVTTLGYVKGLEALMEDGKHDKLIDKVAEGKKQLETDNSILQNTHGALEEAKEMVKLFDNFFQNNGAGSIRESGGLTDGTQAS